MHQSSVLISGLVSRNSSHVSCLLSRSL